MNADILPLEQRLADSDRHEKEYIAYWKDWWQRNQDRFRPMDDPETPGPRDDDQEPYGTH